MKTKMFEFLSRCLPLVSASVNLIKVPFCPKRLEEHRLASRRFWELQDHRGPEDTDPLLVHQIDVIRVAATRKTSCLLDQAEEIWNFKTTVILEFPRPSRRPTPL